MLNPHSKHKMLLARYIEICHSGVKSNFSLKRGLDRFPSDSFFQNRERLSGHDHVAVQDSL